MSLYPIGIDSEINLPTIQDGFNAVNAAVVNRLRDAVLAIEGELGIKPSGTNGTVRARLEYIESLIAGGGGGGGGGGGTVPAGTGFRHVISGIEDANAKLVTNSDISNSAFITSNKLVAPGLNQQLIINDSGSFAGASDLLYDKILSLLHLPGLQLVDGDLRIWDGNALLAEFQNENTATGLAMFAPGNGNSQFGLDIADDPVDSRLFFGDGTTSHISEWAPDFISFGLSAAGTGYIRTPSANQNFIAARASGGSTNMVAIGGSGIDELFIGADKDAGARWANVYIRPSSNVFIGVAASNVLQVTSTNVNLLDSIALQIGSTNPASAGDIRTRNVFNMNFRNALNSANGTLIRSDSSNIVWVGDDTVTTHVIMSASGSASTRADSGFQVKNSAANAIWATIDSTQAQFADGIPLKLGTTNPATAGDIRTRSAFNLKARNSINGGNITLLDFASDTLFVGATAAGTENATYTAIQGSSVYLSPGGTVKALVNSTGIQVQDSVPISMGSTNAATTGDLRFRNICFANFRNAGFTGDLRLWETDSSNNLYLGTDAGYNSSNQVAGIKLFTNAGSVTIGTGSTTKFAIDSTGPVVSDGVSLRLGTTNPAAAGNVRLQNNTTIMAFRNALNNGDRVALASDGANQLFIGSDSSFANEVAVTKIDATSNVAIHNGGVRKLYVDSSSLTLADSVNITLGATNPAGSGDIRTRQGFTLKTRTNSGGGDISTLAVSGDIITVGDIAASQGVNLRSVSGATHNLATIGGIEYLSVTSTVTSINTATAQWLTGVTTPKINQADNSTNSATATSLTVQAQNATGTTAIGGVLALTSGTGTSANGALQLQSGGTNVIVVDSTSQVTLKQVTTIQSGDSKVIISDIIRDVQTTNATITDGYTWTIADEAITLVDAVITAIKSDGTQAASYKRALTFRRHSGTVSLIGTVRDNGTDEDDTNWDVTIDNSTSTGRIRVTGASSTTIRWHICARLQAGIV